MVRSLASCGSCQRGSFQHRRVAVHVKQIQVLEELSVLGVIVGHETDVDEVQEILCVESGQYDFFYVFELVQECL